MKLLCYVEESSLHGSLDKSLRKHLDKLGTDVACRVYVNNL